MVTPPEEVPVGAVPAGEMDPLWYIERCVWTDRMVETLQRGGPEGGRWYWLHDKVFAERTLRAAYARVAANRGSPGVDQVTVEAFGDRLDEEISHLLKAWKTETYRPQAIRRVWIPKPGSDEQRPLGIPTVRDRVVQGALRLVLEPIFEIGFSPQSHGFRPGRNAQGALTEVLTGVQAGEVWVVDADFKGYFDSIPHARLLSRIHRRVTDRRILGLIEQFLQAGIMEQGEEQETEAGTPQGGVISPLLANIYLDELDQRMASSGRRMIRYADDLVILCRSREEAERALADVQSWTAEAGLTLHPTKTRIVDMGQHGNHVDFLGYRLQRHNDDKTGGHRYLRLVRPKSMTKMQDGIRQRTSRTNGNSLPTIIGQLNLMLGGWFAYVRSAHRSIHCRIDQTVRRRLRAILDKRRGCPGWGGGRAHNRWPNAFFTEQGLLSLQEAHAQYLHSYRGTR